ncbi:hypothetical protein D3C79_883490 [compost metagenome]
MQQCCEQAATNRIGRVVFEQVIGQFRAMVGAGDRGNRGNPFRPLGRSVARGQGALAVAEQVDLVGPCTLANTFDDQQQLLAAHLTRVER